MLLEVTQKQRESDEDRDVMALALQALKEKQHAISGTKPLNAGVKKKKPEMELGPATVTPMEKSDVEVMPNWPPKWAPRPVDPQDRKLANQRTDTAVNFMDSFGALPRAGDSAADYRERSRRVNDIYALASQHQPNLGARRAIDLSDSFGALPRADSADGYRRRAAFVDSLYKNK